MIIEHVGIPQKDPDDLLLPFGFEFGDDARKPDDNFRVRTLGKQFFEQIELIARELAKLGRG
jgi:hypothetical protein